MTTNLKVIQGGRATSNPIDLVLDRLRDHDSRLRRIRPGRWVCRCPAHEDRTPSLTITESDSGNVLLKCWPGCTVDAIVSSLGLSLSDLFPKEESYQPSRKPRYSATDVVETCVAEAFIMMVALRHIRSGGALSQVDDARLTQAISTINRINSEVLHGR